MKRTTVIVMLIVGSVSTLVVWYGRWNNAPYHSDLDIIRGDGQGFYAWLPAVVIHRDLSFSFFGDTSLDIAGFFQKRFVYEHNGKQVQKTPCGTALLITPFFVANHALRELSGKKSTGYEASYQKCVSAAALFYFLAGLWFFGLVLRRFTEKKYSLLFAIVALAFGTNLFYYAIYHPSMSHVYSFALIAFWTWLLVRFVETRAAKFLFVSALVLGFIYLVRPVNLLVLAALPFLCGGWKEMFAVLMEIFRPVYRLVICMLLFFVIVFVQLLLNYLQCGQWFVWTYKNEGFNFFNPRLWSVLFSFDKGWLVYTPIAAAALTGSFLVMNRKKLIAYWFFLLVMVWIVSSWWNWNYGSGFGLRAFVDFYALVFIPLIFIQSLNGWVRGMVISAVCAFIALNQLQIWQLNHNILHPEGITREQYKYVFLKTAARYENSLGSGNEMPMKELSVDTTYWGQNDFDGTPQGQWSASLKCDDGDAEHAGHFAQCLNDSVLYSSTFHISDMGAMMNEDFFAMVELDRKELSLYAAHEAVLVFTYRSENGNTRWWNKLRLNDFPREEFGVWRAGYYSLRIPAAHDGDELLIYVYNPAGTQFMIDNFNVRLRRYAHWEY